MHKQRKKQPGTSVKNRLTYAWMVIYTPLHMLDLGFTWEEIGQIFTIMLIPFVLVEYPAGWLADKYIGETEMMSADLIADKDLESVDRFTALKKAATVDS